MTRLNRRQEKFAVFIAAGMPAYQAYPQAGYAFNEGNCYRMKGNERVQARVKELIEEAFSKDELGEALTPEWIKTRLITKATKADRDSDQLRALELLAKYQEDMTDIKQPVSLQDEVRGLIGSLGYGMAKAMLEERGIVHVLDALDITPEATVVTINSPRNAEPSGNIVNEAEDKA